MENDGSPWNSPVDSTISERVVASVAIVAVAEATTVLEKQHEDEINDLSNVIVLCFIVFLFFFTSYGLTGKPGNMVMRWYALMAI